MRYLLILLVLSSCITERKCYDKFPPKTTVDTVVVDSIAYRDTLIFVPGDTIIFQMPDLCPNMDTIVVFKEGKVKVVRKDSILTFDYEQKEKELTAKLMDKYKSTVITKTIVVKEPIKFWQMVFFWLGVFFSVGLLLFVIWMAMS
jgi:hypothetical protein